MFAEVLYKCRSCQQEYWKDYNEAQHYDFRCDCGSLLTRMASERYDDEWAREQNENLYEPERRGGY